MVIESFDTAFMPTSASPSMTTADHVLQVLAVLAQQGHSLSAAEFMERRGLARSTLYRQLARLKRWGFVLESEGRYAPGPLSLQLALGFDLASHLVCQARPDLQALAEQSHESVGLIVTVDDQAICLDMVESQQSLRCSFEKGRSVPLRAGASAKCLLAHLPHAAEAAVLDSQYEPDSAERQAAQTELEAIREAGFAASTGEVDPGVGRPRNRGNHVRFPAAGMRHGAADRHWPAQSQAPHYLCAVHRLCGGHTRHAAAGAAFHPVLRAAAVRHFVARFFMRRDRPGALLRSLWEVVRDAIQSIDRGQMEAARSIGMSSGLAMRSVVLPQAVVRMISTAGQRIHRAHQEFGTGVAADHSRRHA